MPASILVPVDFSLSCHNAYRYAIRLAKDLDLNLILAHYYSSSIDPGVPFSISGDGTIHGTYVQRLRDFAMGTSEGSDYPLTTPPTDAEITFETEVVFSVSAAIIARAARSDVSLVVMAPRSSEAILQRWLGSTATTVSEACNKPVCIVPEGSTYNPWKTMVVANNRLVAEPVPLAQLDTIAGLFHSELHFVHVAWPARYGPLEFVPWKLMERLATKTGAEPPYEVVTIDNADITQGLNNYATNVNADLLVIVNSLRHRWRSLVEATLTQDLALRTERPLLVLHTGDRQLSADLLRAESAAVN